MVFGAEVLLKVRQTELKLTKKHSLMLHREASPE